MTTTITLPRAQKRERLVARVTAEDKAVIVHAAALAGQSVGSFMVAEARKAALSTIKTRERIVLNAEQSRRFVEALLAPPRPPTPATVGGHAGLQSHGEKRFGSTDPSPAPPVQAGPSLE